MEEAAAACRHTSARRVSRLAVVSASSIERGNDTCNPGACATSLFRHLTLPTKPHVLLHNAWPPASDASSSYPTPAAHTLPNHSFPTLLLHIPPPPLSSSPSDLHLLARDVISLGISATLIWKKGAIGGAQSGRRAVALAAAQPPWRVELPPLGCTLAQRSNRHVGVSVA